MKPHADPMKNPKSLPDDPKAPRPVQQSQIDLERSARMKRLLNDPLAPFRSRGLFRMFQ